MALEIGNLSATSGLSKKIYDEWFQVISDTGVLSNYTEVNLSLLQTQLKKNSYALAKSIVEYIKNNADVNVISNVTIDSDFWAWFVAFIGVLTTSGGVTLSPAMVLFLATNPIPTSISSRGTGGSLTTQGIN